MSDPTTLLLLACVGCHNGDKPVIKIEPSICPQVDGQDVEPFRQNTSTCISSPEAIALDPAMGDRSIKAVPQPTSSRAVATEVALPLSRSGGDRIRPFNVPDAPSFLGRGSRGEPVQQVQLRLQRLGYYNGPIDGLYGPITTTSVQQFQQAEGLATTGVVNSVTWAKLQRGSEVDLSAPAAEIQAIQQETQPSTVPNRKALLQDAFLMPAQPPLPKDTVEPSKPAVSDPPSSKPIQRRVVLEPFDSSVPSSMTFYLWLLGWAVVYIGGFIVIFLTSDSRLKRVWLSKFQAKHEDVAASAVGTSAIDVEELVIDTESLSEPLPEQPDALPVSDFPAQPELPPPSIDNHAVLASPNSIPLAEEGWNNSTHSAVEHTKLSDTITSRAVAASLEEEIPVAWAEDIFAPLSKEFSDIMHLFNDLVHKENSDNESEPTHELDNKPQVDAANESNENDAQSDVSDSSIASTLIGILSASDSDTGMTYTYMLLDDAEETFLLRDNELRIRNDVLYSIKEDTDFVVTVRRIDANGQQLDESLKLHLGMPELPAMEDDTEQLTTIG